MKLVNDIIVSVTEAEEPVAQTLRRCLVLAYKLKNQTFKLWVENELKGYQDDTELPDYRVTRGTAKGLFLGGFGSEIRDQPLAASVLKKEHRHFATDIRLSQPIAAYEGSDSENGGMFQWPADLVAMYQSNFIEGWALNRAWMEIPSSTIKSLVDTVRTRLLTFALQIQDELPNEDEAAIEAIAPAVIERIFNVTILGGNNVVGTVQEFNAPTVIAGNIESLKAALAQIGVTQPDLIELENNVREEEVAVVEGAQKTLGEKTSAWIKATAGKLQKSGTNLGGAVVEDVVKRLVMDFLGIT
jgi:hypothetical protein